jgi:hypothetical protein
MLVNDKVARKDEEIEELNKLVKRYRKGYEECELVKGTLCQKNK